jgi:hypothetical protein
MGGNQNSSFLSFYQPDVIQNNATLVNFTSLFIDAHGKEKMTQGVVTTLVNVPLT